VIFINTGAFLARYIERDQYHDAAIEHWRTLRDDRRRCFTSNFVLRKRRDSRRIFSFDRHFTIAGFEVEPSRI